VQITYVICTPSYNKICFILTPPELFLLHPELHPGPGKLRLGIMKIANKCVSIY
jgi:hypothetical protein